MLRSASPVLSRAIFAALTGACFPTAPLLAQPAQGETGTTERRPLDLTIPRCRPSSPASEEDEIVICANPREAQRYRLAPQAWNPNGTVASVSRERHELYEQGDSGIGSCSTVGPGGWTGCMLRAWKSAREQHGR